MINLLFDLLQFLVDIAPLLTSTFVFLLLAILLSKSIKKHSTIYYTILSLPFFLVAIPFFARLMGFEVFNLVRIPFLGLILRDYIHMGTFGFPLLIIIMYVGALNPKIEWVKKLLNIRKELSIISGFPVLTHSLVRVANNFPNALKFFVDNDGYMSTTKVSNELGAGITSFSFVLGILILALFLPLWITSFKSIHKRMGNARWKKLQKWSYAMYAMLFIHAMGIQLGFLLNPRERDVPKPAVETSVAAIQKTPNDSIALQMQRPEKNEGNIENANPMEKRGGANSNQKSEQVRSKRNGPDSGKVQQTQISKFTDIKVSHNVKRYIHIATLLIIFGSYLVLRLKKAKRDKKK